MQGGWDWCNNRATLPWEGGRQRWIVERSFSCLQRTGWTQHRSDQLFGKAGARTRHPAAGDRSCARSRVSGGDGRGSARGRGGCSLRTHPGLLETVRKTLTDRIQDDLGHAAKRLGQVAKLMRATLLARYARRFMRTRARPCTWLRLALSWDRQCRCWEQLGRTAPKDDGHRNKRERPYLTAQLRSCETCGHLRLFSRCSSIASFA
jgi:hypothetical protein